MRFKENPLLDCKFRVKLHLKTYIALSLRDSCDIGFRVQFNAEFPRQVMNCPIEFSEGKVFKSQDSYCIMPETIGVSD